MGKNRFPRGRASMRRASALMLPRLVSTLTRLPSLIPINLASSELISTKGVGTSRSRREVLRVMVPV